MGKFKIIKKEIEDVFTVEPTVFGDERGYFMETYNENDFKDQGINLTFVQDNQSKSTKGVLRGLHFQYNRPQGKLVRVIRGKVFDVAVDLRKDSNTYGKWVGETLSEDNKKQLFIPKGFAHGFLALTDNVEFEYKVSGKYDKASERSFRWDDPDVNIPWGTDTPILSDKDAKAPLLGELKEEDLFKLNSIKNE